MRRWIKSQDGQAVVETALLLPLLLLILMGVFVVGYWLYIKQVTVAAAREGARVGAQTGSKSSAVAAARAVFQSVDTDKDGTRLKISATTEPDNQRDSSLVVQVSYQIPFGFKYFQNQYEDGNPGKPFPFSAVTEQSVARLETDFTNP